MRARRKFVVALLPLGVAACTSFGSEPATSSDADGGGAPDAPAASPACGIASPFVDSFDPSYSPLWSATGAGLSRVPTGGRTGGMGQLTLPSSPSFFSIAVTASCTIDAVAYIQFAKVGDGEADFFVLAETVDASGAVLGFTRNNAAKSFVFEDPAHHVDVVASTLPSGWTKVELKVDPSARTYAATATTSDGGVVADTKGSLPTGWPKGKSIWVKIGAAYVAGITQPWSVGYDDVTVTATPP